jgi:hypothetical protein
LIISDCEGYEAVLLDPHAVPALARSAIIVELHEFAVPGVTATIGEWFGLTHDISLVDVMARDPAWFPQLSHLSEDEVLRVVDEGRPKNPPMQWAVMDPKSVA